MKYINISVKNSDLYAEIAKTTAYAGAKSPEGETVFDRVATVGQDEELLARYRLSAASSLVDHLRAFVTGADFAGDSINLKLEVSGAYDDTLTASVATDAFNYLVSDISARWFRITMPGKSSEYEADARASLSELTRKLYHRKRPQRRSGE